MDITREKLFRDLLDGIVDSLAGSDTAVDEQSTSMSSGPESDEYVAHEAQDALSRLDDGTFGICEACGDSISDERLEEIPYARYCASCAERLDPIFMANYDSDPSSAQSDAETPAADETEPDIMPPRVSTPDEQLSQENGQDFDDPIVDTRKTQAEANRDDSKSVNRTEDILL